jgi:AFG3 family protein
MLRSSISRIVVIGSRASSPRYHYCVGKTRVSSVSWAPFSIVVSDHIQGDVSVISSFANLSSLQQQYRRFSSSVETSIRVTATAERSSSKTLAMSSRRSSSTVTSLWNLRKPEPGQGFDNFIPKTDPSKRSEDDSSKKSSFNDNQNQNNDDQDPNNNNKKNKKQNDSESYSIISTIALLGLAWLLQKQVQKSRHDGDDDDFESSSNSGKGGRLLLPHEIQWHTFMELLERGKISKILITETENSAMARIEVHDHIMMDHPPEPMFGSDHPPNYASSSSDAMMHGATHTDPHVETMEGLGHSSSSSSIPMSRRLTRSSSSSSSSSSPKLVYRMDIGNAEAFERKLEQIQKQLNMPQDIPVQYTAEPVFTKELIGIVPGLLLAAMVYGMMRFGSSMSGGFGSSSSSRGGMGGIFSFGKSTAKKIKPEDVKITFADVAGCEEAKREIVEFVDFLKDSKRFTKLGAKIPKGALLCGPPGTGKTLLAKAVAGEAGVPFYSISGSDFIEMFVGVGPSRVRDLFAEARDNAPCIVFIDEIDAVGRQRGRGNLGGNDERENTLNQLLVEMDGFAPTTGVVVLAGTNRVDILDQALTRPGRFDRQIVVDKPDIKGRKAIFLVHLQGIKLEDDADDLAGRLAGLTPGFAGADIANICNEAAIFAARRKGETVTMEDFEKATDRIIGGLESNKIMSKEERSIVAHHEAGHAVAGWFLEHADPLLKVTIIPRSSGALGFAQYLPKEVFLRTREQIMDIVCMALAGRAAEEIFFGRVTTGASDDLKRVTGLVYSTIQLYGMNSRLGQLSFPKNPNAFYEDRPYSEKTAKVMDEEAKSIVDAAYQRTLSLLREKKQEVEKVANLLLDKETITHDDIIETIGERPFEGDPAYKEFIRRRRGDKDEKSPETSTSPSGEMEPSFI